MEENLNSTHKWNKSPRHFWKNLPPSAKTTFKLLPVVLILAALPLTVWLIQFQQNLRSNAAVNCGTSLQSQIDAATSESVLDLTGCSYTGTATISKPLTLKGFTLNTPPNAKGITVTASNVTIDGVNIIGPQATTYNSNEKGIYVEQTGSSYIDNLTIKNSEVSNYGYGPLYLRHVKNLTIENNNLHDGVYAGVIILSGLTGKISKNNIQRIGVKGAEANSNNAYGIALTRLTNSLTDDPQTSDFEVSNNTITDVPTWHAIDTHAGKNLNIFGNTIYRTSRAIFITTDSVNTRPVNITVKDNLVGNPSPVTFNLTGITTYYVNGITITNNAISAGYGCPSGTNTHNCVYDYNGLSTNLVSSGNYIGETLTTQTNPTPTSSPNLTSTPTPTKAPTPTLTSSPTPTPKPTGTPTPTPTLEPFSITSGPTVIDISDTQATIQWYLSSGGNGQVEYGKTTSYGSFSTQESSYTNTRHTQVLYNLTPGAIYHYRVKSTNQTGTTVTSADNIFTTTGSLTPVPTNTVTPTPILSEPTPTPSLSPGQAKKCIKIINWKFCF